MAVSDALAAIQQLTRNAETLAALGALLSTRCGVVEPTETVLGKLHAVQEAYSPALLDDLAPEEANFLRALVLANLRRVTAFAEAPDTQAQWVTDDPVILQTQGQASRLVTRLISAHAENDPSLAERLTGSHRFLDVGSGTGWISLSMAERWPNISVDGIDIHGPALEIAAANLSDAGLQQRVSFSRLDVAKLDKTDHYAVAFIPFIFIPEAVLNVALPALRRALQAGGWLFVATYRTANDPLQQALIDLQTTLSGGRCWSEDDVSRTLSDHGFEVHRDIGTGTGIHLHAARKV